MSPEKDGGSQETVISYEAQRDTNDRLDRNIQASSTHGLIECPVCQSTFRRPEHLKRHFRSHTKEKPFECAQCGRHFSRTDTLHRHELSHHSMGAEGGKDHAHRITVKTFRACFKCATARVRCSGGIPCGRCENRSLECEYPTARRSKAKARKQACQNASSAKEDSYHRKLQVPIASTNENDARLVQDETESPPQMPAFKMTQFQLQLNHPNTSNGSPKGTSDLGLEESITEEQSKGPQIDHRYASAGERNQPSANASKSGGETGIPILPYDQTNIPQGHPNIPASGAQNSLSSEQLPGVDYQLGNIQPAIGNPDIDIEMGPGDNQQTQLGLQQPFLDQSMLSMNWLPNDFFLGTANNQPPLPGFSSHSNLDQTYFLDGSLAQISWLPPVVNGEHSGSSFTGNASQDTPSGSTPLGTDVESSSQYTSAVGDGSSHSSPHDPTARSGNYYVDGAAARLPRYRPKQSLLTKASTGLATVSSQPKSDSTYAIGFPRFEGIGADSMSEKGFRHQIEPSTYNKIHSTFFQLCCTENFIYQKFESENFPSGEVLTNFIHIYFDYFQSVYPIFHFPTFDPNKCHWLVTLAVSTIGCHVAGIPETEKCTAAFHEFLRRAISVEKERRHSDRTPFWLVQTMLLNCIGLLYSDNERTRISAFSSFSDLINLANQERLLCQSKKPRFRACDMPSQQKWMLWIEDEVRRRTGYCIWLVDCTVAYHFDKRPHFTLDDAQAALPSHESLWHANTAENWNHLLDKQFASTNISLYTAVHMIYIEKKLVSETSEFSHILLIHAFYHRMWEVGENFRRPLSFWNPTAKKQSLDSAIPSGSVWLPGIPSYSKWRNSACDCLDILHWAANSTIAQAAGMEHPTVLHLHASRLVLLTPFREIRSLATSLAQEKIRWGEHQRTIEWHYIERWVKHDQYKARLAIIHAGTTLWHVRRYSTNAFHEPGAVFLAVLTLWAYGYCNRQIMQYSNSHSESSDPSLIHLDRPCDDELVQLFVRQGQNMEGNVSGVGDICSSNGPEKVLRLGCETLSGLTSWGISKRFITILKSLAELVSHDSVRANSGPNANGMDIGI